MKKIILILSLLCLCAACNNGEKRKTMIRGDLIFFAEIPVITEGEEGVYIEPITTKTIDTETTRNWEWMIFRTASFHFPEQQASVVIDKSRSTAIEGVDFRLSGTSFMFENVDVVSKKINVEVLCGKLTTSKKLVLKLEYGYDEEENPVESRTKNVLTITLQ